MTLPPGQKESLRFERFGLLNFALYEQGSGPPTQLIVQGLECEEFDLLPFMSTLRRVTQNSDFHCVTTWSVKGLQWGGYKFFEIYEKVIEPRINTGFAKPLVILRGDDGYVTSLPLEDMLVPNVMLADELGGKKIPFEHGAPLRLIAPKHYGYKNVKHLVSITFANSEREYKFSKLWPKLMEHPRGRVDLEERGRYFPAFVFRLLYRPLVAPSKAFFRFCTKKAQRK